MRRWLPFALALGVMVPGVAVRLGPANVSDPIRALLFGVTIVGAAFLLSWPSSPWS